MNRNSSCMRMFQGKRSQTATPLQICITVKLAASQNLLQCGEQEEIKRLAIQRKFEFAHNYLFNIYQATS